MASAKGQDIAQIKPPAFERSIDVHIIKGILLQELVLADHLGCIHGQPVLFEQEARKRDFPAVHFRFSTDIHGLGYLLSPSNLFMLVDIGSHFV